MKMLLPLSLVLTVFCHHARAQESKFLMPLHGVSGRDFWIAYYMDQDPSAGVKDGHCGAKTYDGHMGTDFLLRSFKTMDSGVLVYAIADGRVTRFADGYFDRQKKWISGTRANYIRIKHGRYTADYIHLLKGSLLVNIGDSVHAGQAIGKVGSSGYSAFPHLHLELRDVAQDDNIIDPFRGACNTAIPIQWKLEPVYDTSVYAIDHGFVPYVPGLDTLLERYLVTNTFHNYRDTVACLWALMHGLRSGDRIRVEWYAPDRRLYFTLNHTWKRNWWYDYTWAYLDMPLAKGRWLAKCFVNDKQQIYARFLVE